MRQKELGIYLIPSYLLDVMTGQAAGAALNVAQQHVIGGLINYACVDPNLIVRQLGEASLYVLEALGLGMPLQDYHSMIGYVFPVSAAATNPSGAMVPIDNGGSVNGVNIEAGALALYNKERVSKYCKRS